MKTIMFSRGEYSDYSVLELLSLPDDVDLDALRKQFMDTFFPPFPEKLPRNYKVDMAIWNRAKDWENSQFDSIASLGYTSGRSENRLFIEWLIKENNCTAVTYEEINLDYELKTWQEGRKQ